MATADVLALHRSGPGSFTLVTEETLATRLFDAEQVESDYDLGPRVRLHRSGACWSWDVGYFGIYSWGAIETVSGAVALEGPGFRLGVNPGIFLFESDSRLHSGEANLKPTRYGPSGWFVGFRYLNLDESFAVHELNTPIIDALNIDTDNDLYGGQVGSEFRICSIGPHAT